MRKIIILQGPPASGKSTIARSMQQKMKQAVIVNRDSLRHMAGSYWDPKREPLISSWESALIINALGRDYDVIIDATNLNEKYITRLLIICEACRHKVEYRKVFTPLEVCIERDKNENRQQHVGEDVIRDFFKKYHINEETGEF